MTKEDVYNETVKVRQKAYAPYSHFLVGAGLKLKGSDDLALGCNVENASYGGTICAERSAILQAVARHGKFDPEYMVLVTGSETVDSPCGLCLQVLSEFMSPDFTLYLANLSGIQKTVQLKDLLPRPFDKSPLLKK